METLSLETEFEDELDGFKDWAVYARYLCPVCAKELERDISVFLAHTKQHILDVLRKEHPEWRVGEAAHEECESYYERLFTWEWARR